MLEAERKFSVDNEEGYIEVGETKAKRTREFTLTGTGRYDRDQLKCIGHSVELVLSMSSGSANFMPVHR